MRIYEVCAQADDFICPHIVQKKTERIFEFRHEDPESMIPEREIRYIHAESNYVRVYREQVSDLYAQTMKTVEAMMQESDIIRIHKSIMVNLAYVEGIRNHHVILCDRTVLPIGRTYREAVRQRYLRFRIGKMCYTFSAILDTPT